jgi:hypothetical protein
MAITLHLFKNFAQLGLDWSVGLTPKRFCMLVII